MWRNPSRIPMEERDAAPPQRTELRKTTCKEWQNYTVKCMSPWCIILEGMVKSSQSQKMTWSTSDSRMSNGKINMNEQNNDLTMKGIDDGWVMIFTMEQWWYLQWNGDDIYNRMMMIFTVRYNKWNDDGIYNEALMIYTMKYEAIYTKWILKFTPLPNLFL